MRILLVEDDPSLGATIQSWLLMDRYAVDWVKRGNHAETALRNHDYQCVLGTGEPGSGLGLSIVARIMAMHHGRLTFEDGLDQRGLSVILEFPSSLDGEVKPS